MATENQPELLTGVAQLFTNFKKCETHTNTQTDTKTYNDIYRVAPQLKINAGGIPV